MNERFRRGITTKWRGNKISEIDLAAPLGSVSVAFAFALLCSNALRKKRRSARLRFRASQRFKTTAKPWLRAVTSVMPASPVPTACAPRSHAPERVVTPGFGLRSICAGRLVWPRIENAAGGTGSVTRKMTKRGEGPPSFTLISIKTDQSFDPSQAQTSSLTPPATYSTTQAQGLAPPFFFQSPPEPTDRLRCVRPSPSSSPRWRAKPRPPCSGARATTSTSSRRCVVLGAFRDAVVDGVGLMLAGVVGFGRGEGLAGNSRCWSGW